jgi:Fe2+ transport system protein FeoA
MSQHKTLEQLKPGEAGVVFKVEGEDEVALRLSDLGFWPGTRVVVVRRAPLGDPVHYQLRGFDLALRSNEARRVLVSLETEVVADE